VPAAAPVVPAAAPPPLPVAPPSEPPLPFEQASGQAKTKGRIDGQNLRERLSMAITSYFKSQRGRPEKT
jgi:hypothetical protein